MGVARSSWRQLLGCVQVILCVKGVNEKVRVLALKLLTNLGYASQRCFEKKPQGMYVL